MAEKLGIAEADLGPLILSGELPAPVGYEPDGSPLFDGRPAFEAIKAIQRERARREHAALVAALIAADTSP